MRPDASAWMRVLDDRWVHIELLEQGWVDFGPFYNSYCSLKRLYIGGLHAAVDWKKVHSL